MDSTWSDRLVSGEPSMPTGYSFVVLIIVTGTDVSASLVGSSACSRSLVSSQAYPDSVS